MKATLTKKMETHTVISEKLMKVVTPKIRKVFLIRMKTEFWLRITNENQKKQF
jgi:hypothetical protein